MLGTEIAFLSLERFTTRKKMKRHRNVIATLGPQGSYLQKTSIKRVELKYNFTHTAGSISYMLSFHTLGQKQTRLGTLWVTVLSGLNSVLET